MTLTTRGRRGRPCAAGWLVRGRSGAEVLLDIDPDDVMPGAPESLGLSTHNNTPVDSEPGGP
ncbi:hypothetical protein Slu03_17740 [Sediminihabitans luteus]|nr:hypothetical protein Slu03_17740 [Sediminihabitans luteus]